MAKLLILACAVVVDQAAGSNRSEAVSDVMGGGLYAIVLAVFKR